MSFVATFLALVGPHLPGLVTKAAEAVVDEGAKKAVFEAVPAGVRAVWARLVPKVAGNAIAQGAADAVAADPGDADSVEMLKLALKKLLTEIEKSEPGLLAELQGLMADGESTAAVTVVNIDVDGDGNQVTGINSGKTVQMGDVAGDVNF
jgi:hypothetical protein